MTLFLQGIIVAIIKAFYQNHLYLLSFLFWFRTNYFNAFQANPIVHLHTSWKDQKTSGMGSQPAITCSKLTIETIPFCQLFELFLYFILGREARRPLPNLIRFRMLWSHTQLFHWICIRRYYYLISFILIRPVRNSHLIFKHSNQL